MARLSNRQLLQVMLDRADYVPEALTAAEAELRSRGIPEAELSHAISAGETRKAEVDRLAALPLSTRLKVLYFLLSFLLFTPFVAIFFRYYAEKGMAKRSVESIQQVVLGMLFYFAVLSVLNRFFWL